MPGQGRSRGRPDEQRRDAEETPAAPTGKVDPEVLEGIDGLLDEIDQVLEVNAEEFVRGYVQKGGE